MLSILSNWAGALSLLIFPATFAIALPLYAGWGASAVKEKKIVVGVLIIIAASIWLLDISSRAGWMKNSEHLIQVTEKEFTNSEVILDGHDYEHCKFTSVTFTFNGGNFAFAHNELSGIRIQCFDPKVNATMFFLGKMGLLAVPLLEGQTSIVIPPGITVKN